MALIRRHNTDDKAIATSEADPLRWMRDLVHWDAFQLQTSMPQWFGPGYEQTFSPAFEVKETKDTFQFIADLPGMKESDLAVKVTGNRLSISGKREAEKEDKCDTYYAYERSYGSFQRTFVLPEGLDTDHIHAELETGVLTVTLPKNATVATRTIAIKAGEGTKS